MCMYVSVSSACFGPPNALQDITIFPFSLLPPLLQTLLVCFLRASMVTKVSGRLWDNLSAVLSSLTRWREVIEQWKV